MGSHKAYQINTTNLWAYSKWESPRHCHYNFNYLCKTFPEW